MQGDLLQQPGRRALPPPPPPTAAGSNSVWLGVDHAVAVQPMYLPQFFLSLLSWSELCRCILLAVPAQFVPSLVVNCASVPCLLGRALHCLLPAREGWGSSLAAGSSQMKPISSG